ncbi:prepilin-type N-terminal cleavage/methylation domain-containing protein [Aquabacterium sp.]|uniref:prepilin-type N-terminal cleavage/methylation domain-containing protein n=1 Tax=Aquabacterium sp. TaxID=1872578 RepID=UPI003784763A
MRPFPKQTSRQRGVTLIEALVAMAVMAFGMLAIVGVQSTLRINADLAKQRAEATRIAEQQIEAIRAFRTVGSGNAGASEYDNLVSQGTPATITLPESNTSYQRTVAITPQADGIQQTVKVLVTWTDRYDVERRVVLRDVISRTAPTLSGLVSAMRTVTVVGQRKNRHPSIPLRAGDQIGGNESVFKPKEGGTLAWVFNNTTGVITRVCVVSAGSQSGTISSGDLVSCSTTNAQLLSGFVRFNLRGVTNNLGSISVYKPVAGDTIAWVIDNSQSKVVRSCNVPAGTSTAALLASDVPPGCASVNPSFDLPIGTFDPADSASYVLTANDSEFPAWPAMNLSVSLQVDSTGHASPAQCVTNAPGSSVEANAPYTVEYFCIIYPNSTQSWFGKSTIAPAAFSDGDGVTAWTIGTAAGNYRVCRYTTASTDFTDNADHPAYYSKWSSTCGGGGQPACTPVKGNLINQNFLIIDGTKTCPTDTAINPAAGDLVNSNTLQHQP